MDALDIVWLPHNNRKAHLHPKWAAAAKPQQKRHCSLGKAINNGLEFRMLKKKQIIRTTLALAIAGASIGASADPARDYGGQGKSLGQQLMEKMNPPASPGGGDGGGHNSKFTFDLGNGQSITMDSSELAPDGDGMYLEKPSMGELQGVYDSDYDMDTMGRAAQGKLYQDAQNMGNPFDPDPEKRKLAGPSSITGSAYQVVLGVSEARNYYGDMSNDPIIAKADQILGDEDLLSDFGDCSVATELTETSRLAHLPDEQTCTRVLAPAASSCEVRHEVVVEEVRRSVNRSFTTSALAVLEQIRTVYSSRIVGNYSETYGDYIPTKLRVDITNEVNKHGGLANLSNLQFTISSYAPANTYHQTSYHYQSTGCGN